MTLTSEAESTPAAMVATPPEAVFRARGLSRFDLRADERELRIKLNCKMLFEVCRQVGRLLSGMRLILRWIISSRLRTGKRCWWSSPTERTITAGSSSGI